MKIKAGVVGLGNIGLQYDLQHKRDYVLTHTKAYLKSRHFDLKFGVDLNVQARRSFQRFSKRPAFKSIQDAGKKSADIDVLSVCLPLAARKNVLKDVKRVFPRLKVLLLEKPLAQTVREAGNLISQGKKEKIQICVNYLRRFETDCGKIKEVIRTKKLGDITHINIIYNGGFYNNASHFIDYILFAFGQPKSWRMLKKVKLGDNDFSIDVVLIYPAFKVFINSVGTKCPVGEIDFWFENGRIVYRKFGLELSYYKVGKDSVFKAYKEIAFQKKVTTQLPYAMKDVTENIYQFLMNKTALKSTAATALQTLKLCENIRLSN